MAATRANWTNYTTGICLILFVMAQAAAMYTQMSGQGHWMNLVQAWADPVVLPVLFLMAGLFLPRTLFGSKSTFFDRKVLKFVYFFLVWHILQTLILFPLLGTGGALGLAEALLRGTIQPGDGLWILPALALFGLVTWLVRLLSITKVLAVAGLLQCLNAGGFIVTGWKLIDAFTAFYVFFYAGYAGAGLYRRFADQIISRRKDVPFALAIWAGIHTVLVLQGTAGLPVISLILGVGGSFGLIALGALLSTRPHADLFDHVGRQHLAIYVGYFPLVVLAQRVLMSWSFQPEPGLATLAISLGAIVLTLAVYGLIRRTPLKALYRRPKALRLKGAQSYRAGRLIGGAGYKQPEEA